MVFVCANSHEDYAANTQMVVVSAGRWRGLGSDHDLDLGVECRSGAWE